jgi:uncharacterized protein YgiM (DUF1202 family)
MLFLALLFSATLQAADTLSPLITTETLWMHGSWVNVRETAETQSTVIGHVTTNTKVEVTGRNGKTCEIVWGEAKRGFVPCRLLGKKALTLAETARTPFTGASGAYFLAESLRANPQYSPPRAFWIMPSAITLREAGIYFQRTLLSKEQWTLEQEGNNDYQPPPKLVRYPVPEFEAMKALLAEGIVAAPNWDLPLLSCRQRQAAQFKQTAIFSDGWVQRMETYYPGYGDVVVLSGTDHFWGKYSFLEEDCRRLDQLQPLPKIRPSFFRSAKDILRGNAYIEQISAHFGIVERGRVVSGPRWAWFPTSEHFHYSGAWDIGLYELKLDKPIIEHVIERNGQVGAYQWTPQERFDFDSEDLTGDCAEAPKPWSKNNKTLLSGYPAVQNALLWFQSPVALPLQKAKVSRSVKTLEEIDENVDEKGNHGRIISTVTIYEVDLDHDDVADFVKWDFEGEYRAYVVFININGKWYPFEKDYGEQCGC